MITKNTSSIKSEPLTKIDLDDLKLFKTGKVRSVFDFEENLLIVASDRISAFDYVLEEGIPKKAEVLTKISKFWFDFFSDDNFFVENHLISTDVEDFPQITHKYKKILEGRSMFVKKTELIPFECVVRGYIIGSGWKDYQKTGEICGNKLPKGLSLAEKLPEPIFTPATKAEQGDHDENVSIKYMKSKIGNEISDFLINTSINIYNRAAEYAEKKGIIIADTKFEFGVLGNKIILIDEILTPDSSRFWPKKSYETGISPPSYDKQIVRDYLNSTDWDKSSPPPPLSKEIVDKTASAYEEIQGLLI
jgi:phosphoribosylaminoimidazole-succinocarboxamide synthase